MAVIDYYFTMASPWAYLGHAAFMGLARRLGFEVRFKPISTRTVFPETGGLPLPQRHPARQRYRLVELQRWRDKRGLPLKPNARGFPFDPSLADRVVAALVDRGDDPDPFMRRAFRAVWDEERGLAEADTLRDLLARDGLDAEAVLARAESDEIRARYEANAREAIAADVIGSPCYVRDGEVFWGQDRLELLEDAIRSGRPAYGPVS
jgi:2-hydroxychromene-2-carboxylate isomerase